MFFENEPGTPSPWLTLKMDLGDGVGGSFCKAREYIFRFIHAVLVGSKAFQP